MNPVIVLVLGIAAVAVIVVRLLVPRRKLPSAPAFVAIIGAGLAVVGAVLAVVAYAQVAHALGRRSWPSAGGIVSAARVTGKDSFAPEIDYEFKVDSVTYTGSSDRHVPLFGNRRRTLEVAEKEVAAFKPGTPVIVFYNPLDPHENTIQPEPRWNYFAQTGLGVFLFAGGLFVVLLPRKRQVTASV